MDKMGTSFVFPSDEFFIKAHLDFPPVEHYEGFLQYENGVGMVPLFVKEASAWVEMLPAQFKNPKKISLVTGFSFGGILQKILSAVRVDGLSLQVFPVLNEFFGNSVTVAGLLTGGDIIQALRSEKLGDLLVIPSVTLNQEGTHFLDNLTPQDLSKELGVPVRVVDSKSKGLWEMMKGLQ